MSDIVTLRHPKLPPGQVIKIDRRRAGVRFAAGWVEVDPKPEVNESKPAVEPESEQPAVEPAKPKRRSRTNTEEQ